MRIRAGDTVVVITGKDKGKTGQVLRVLKNKDRVVVADVNIRTRHMRKTPNRPGEIVKYEASIHASNVMLLDPKSKKRTRVGYKVDEKGKVRVAKRSGDAIKKAAVASTKPAKEEKKDTKTTANKTAEKKESPKKDAAAPATDSKQPFWKKMGFGAEAMEEEGDDKAQSGSDHSVPDQVERSSTRASNRGN